MIQQLQISDQQKNEIVFSKENIERIKRLKTNADRKEHFARQVSELVAKQNS